MRRVTMMLLLMTMVLAAPQVDSTVDAGWQCTKSSFKPHLNRVTCDLWERVEDGDEGGSDPPPDDDGGREGGFRSAPPRKMTPIERWMAANCTVTPTATRPRENPDGTTSREYLIVCAGDGSYGFWAETFWSVVRNPAAPAPPPDPERLVRFLYASMRQVVPQPTLSVAPADSDLDGYAYVQTPTIFWIDEWSTLSKSLTLGSTTVTLTITPETLEVDLGNGEVHSCVDPPPFPPNGRVDTFGGCAYVYRHSSAMAPNGETFAVTPRLRWSVRWTSNQGQGGGFDSITTVGATRELPVAEIQAIVTDVGAGG